ncbi:unnamed protein product [Fraxinus pennsylvanica]|uniref:Uncharacterized protein n=1 Tax=Fraxinus pennsylvanica TaxID=56036 RepID=A0AAD2DVP1_9LAMI|nr:unnamed protein product [Fraxinus pennsylvanica]
MEGFAKVFFILNVFLGALTMNVTEARSLKSNEEVVQPQTFGIRPPGFPEILPSPFPPGFRGLPLTFPSPGLPGFFPNPGLGFGSLCSFLGIICPPPPSQPISPTGSTEGGAGVSLSP